MECKGRPLAIAGGLAVGVLLALFALWPERESATSPPGNEAAGKAPSPGVGAARGERAGATTPAAPSKDGRRAAERPEQGRVLLAAAWGSGPGQLGRDRPAEGSAAGPMSFTFDPRGNLVVLDNANDRIVRFDPKGGLLDFVPTTQRAPQDLVIGRDGAMAVLDRTVDKNVAVFDESGRPLGVLPLEGSGIEDLRAVTGVHLDGKDVYAEVEHGELVKLGSADGAPAAERSTLEGQPTPDGKYLVTAFIAPSAPGPSYLVNVVDRALGQHLYTQQYTPAPFLIHQLLGVGADSNNILYVGLVLEAPREPGGAGEVPEDGAFFGRLFCVDAETRAVIGAADLPLPEGPEEQFRTLRAKPTGGVVYAYAGRNGLSFQEYDCR